MEYIDYLFTMLSKLHYFQIIFLLCALVVFLAGPYWIKSKYLKRTNQQYDEVIEDRNSWILLPPPYNLIEKTQLIIVYITAFVLGILAVNLKG